MYVYKDISEKSVETGVVHYNQELKVTNTATSEGMSVIKFVSGSISSSYWSSLNVLFYTSGSPTLTDSKFSYHGANWSIYNSSNPQHLTKFHNYSSGSILSIPQTYYGDGIKPGSFTLLDNSTSTAVTLKDDKYGNLYPVGNTISSSTNSPSSSDNYIGNIFYDLGIVTITETGSYTTGVTYDKLLGDNYTVNFDSTEKIYTHNYSVVIEPNEFNHSLNYSLRCLPSGAIDTSAEAFLANPYMCSEFTGSNFTPYLTEIHLYDPSKWSEGNREPVISARLPKPLKISKKITTVVKLKLDM